MPIAITPRAIRTLSCLLDRPQSLDIVLAGIPKKSKIAICAIILATPAKPRNRVTPATIIKTAAPRSNRITTFSSLPLLMLLLAEEAEEMDMVFIK